MEYAIEINNLQKTYQKSKKSLQKDALKSIDLKIKKGQIIGTKIINEIDSSNLTKTEYDTESKKLIIEFKNGMKYEYDEVPHQLYTQFRMSESQGKFFSTKIAKTFKYKKL